MLVYNADREKSVSKNFIFKHIGTSKKSAADRIEGMFAHQNLCTFSLDYTVSVHNVLGHIIQTKTLHEHLLEFCHYAGKFSISEYYLKVSRSLRLVDLWGDDPIGSAGPAVIDQDEMSILEKKEIKALFYPFSGVIYPLDIFNVMSKKSIKSIKRKYLNNDIFMAEFSKRKIRSKAIGENFSSAQYQEIIWLDFTFKLKEWALDKGYDSLVYSNKKEGDGEDTYITLLPNQLSHTGNKLEFCIDLYLKEMPDIIKAMINRNPQSAPNVIYHALWGQRNPMRYWK